MRETGADAADDEGLPALGPSDGPPESPKSGSGHMFLELRLNCARVEHRIAQALEAGRLHDG